VGSLLVLMGGARSKPLLIAGGVLVAASFAVSLWLALGPERDRPRPRWFWWALGVGVAAYVVMALGGALDDWQFAIAAVFAAIVPLTALSLVLAMFRERVLPHRDEEVIGEPRVTHEVADLERTKRSPAHR
jgi:hypothetical protein